MTIRGPSVHHFVLADTPDICGADISGAVADIDAAPAVAAFADAADDAVLGPVTHLCAVVRIGADRPRVAGLDDRGAAVAEQGDQHPALRSVGVLNQPPGLVFLDYPDGQVAALVEPDVGVGLARAGVGHRLTTGDRRPIGWLLLLRGNWRRDRDNQECGKQPPKEHHAPVRILSTSCFTVVTNPFE